VEQFKIYLALATQLLGGEVIEFEKDQRCWRSRRPWVITSKVVSSLALMMYQSEGLHTPHRGTQHFLTLGLSSLVYFLVAAWIPLLERNSIPIAKETM
jgi:hypothetical protein